MATIEESTMASHPDEGRPKYKSFKKKFRKMKRTFDIAMQQSNALFLEEHDALKTAKRIAQENDQILDLLLDVNNSAQIPVDKRIDVITEAPGLSPIPSLVSDDDIASLGTLQTQEGQTILAELKGMLAKKEAISKASSLVPKSLAQLISTVPHLTSTNPALPQELLTELEPYLPETVPYAYLSPDQLDDYIYDIDASLGTAPPVPIAFNAPASPDLAFGNYHSPYNWLRRNQPQIFLQDGEGSEKSHGKPGALRGAGKRASIPAPTRTDALEIVEEDGQGYDFALGGPSTKYGKRKRDDDDGGYHPKSGTKDENGKPAKKPRVSKKKKDDSAETEKAPTKRPRKPKAPSPDPDAHPFGPM